jgi:hypothetical protein
VPETIGAAILSALTVEAAVGTTAIVGTLTVNAAIGSAVILGTSLAIQTLTAPDQKQRLASQQLSFKQALFARRKVYGSTMLSGGFVARDTAGGRFYTGVYLCEGPINRFVEYHCNDIKTALPGGSLGGIAGVAPWQNLVTLEGHLGTAPQAVSPILSELGYWDGHHRLDGCAYLVMRAAMPLEPAKYFKKYYPSGTFPSTKALIEGSLVRDIRDPAQTSDPTTWQYSPIAALCIRDRLIDRQWGFKVPEALIDDASFIAKANVDSETITTKDGRQFPRYYLGGVCDLTKDPADDLQGMLQASDADLYLTPAGKIGIRGGRYVVPEVTLTDPDIISISIEAGSGKRATFNRLKTSFVSAPHGWEMIEGDPLDDLDAQAEAGDTLEAEFPCSWVQLHNQLRRLAWIYYRKKNPRWRVSLVTGRGGLPAVFEDVINLQLTRYPILNGAYTVSRPVISSDGARCSFELTSTGPEVYAFNAQTDEGLEPTLPGASAAASPPDPPTGLTVTIERRAVSGDINATFLRLSAVPEDRPDRSLVGRYRIVGDATWIDMAADTGDPWSVVSSVLTDGAQYEVEGAVSNFGRSQVSNYTPATPSPITATADTTPPGPPDGFVANGSAGQATGAFTAPNSPNFGFARLYRGTSADFAQATAIRTFNGSASQAFDWSDPRPTGTYRYWVRAFNRSGFGDASSTAGPITVTVT